MDCIKVLSQILFKIRICGKTFGIPFRIIPNNTKTRFLFTKLRGRKWIVGSGPYSYWLGIFEYEKRVLFEKIAAEGSIVFDIGAHVGFYTLLSSVLVGSRGQVFAFEPVPRNLFYLREHLRLNQITNVTVIEAAVADSDGKARFSESEDSTEGHIASEGGLEVETASLDKLISMGKVPFPQVVKIDVEGAEMLVLSGAKSMIANVHPTIFLSTHSNHLHQQCCQFLKSLGYELESISEKPLDLCDEILAYYPRN